MSTAQPPEYLQLQASLGTAASESFTQDAEPAAQTDAQSAEQPDENPEEQPAGNEFEERVKLDGSLILHSRRTERLRKKQLKKQKHKSLPPGGTILDLPYELLVHILSYVYPSDLIRLSRTNRALRDFIASEEPLLARNIITWRYPAMEKSLRLPVLLENVDVAFHPVAQSRQVTSSGAFPRWMYDHVLRPDTDLVCSCLTCMLRWNSLAIVLDFAHWQGHLDRGEPIPMIKRGTKPLWNHQLIVAHAQVIMKALRQPLWYACILERHLTSTVQAIKRHRENKGNQRRRFQMSIQDELAGTDAFLERKGPPNMDFPFNRDNYYMLEVYLPNRGWREEEQRWVYLAAGQHDIDVANAIRRYQGLA